MDLQHNTVIEEENVDIAILPKDIKERISKVDLAASAPDLTEDDIDDLEIESTEIAADIYTFLESWEEMSIEQRADHVDQNN